MTRADPAERSSPPPWVATASRAQFEEGLFRFLSFLSTAEPGGDWPQPLIVDRRRLQAVYRQLSPQLAEALRQRLDALLLEFGPDTGRQPKLEIDRAVWGVALATHNCLVPPLAEDADPLDTYLAALIETLPPAGTASQALAYHALLDRPAALLPVLSPGRAAAMHALLARSPLTAVAHLHHHTPAPLFKLAVELLPGWGAVPDPAPGHDLGEWLEVLRPLLGESGVARHLRQRWLALPETRLSCRNLGLLLEALRRRGERDVLLAFYEAYEVSAATVGTGRLGARVRRWPVLDLIGRLLSAGGTSEAAVRLNRWGNQWFLKFRPLLEIVIDEGGVVPRDYRHLTTGLVTALQPLSKLTTEVVESTVEFGQIDFDGGQDDGAPA